MPPGALSSMPRPLLYSTQSSATIADALTLNDASSVARIVEHTPCALVEFLGPKELGRLMQTRRRRLKDLTFRPRRANLVLSTNAKVALMKKIPSVHSLKLGHKELFISTGSWSPYHPLVQLPLVQLYLLLLPTSLSVDMSLGQASTLQLNHLTRLQVHLRSLTLMELQYTIGGLLKLQSLELSLLIWKHELYDELWHLAMYRHKDDEIATTSDIRRVLEACPNLEALEISEFHPRMRGNDLASTIVVDCPRLKILQYKATFAPTTAMGMHQDPKSHDCDRDAFLPGYVTFAAPVREPFYRKLPPD
ncbi:MAG: hypothetical protein J3R72DRAFT_491878 [Linnemannia gamsii]|nr:MAG: hypothetical protein J3R72DRAFT_491878 [Linnemannia gamsii]